MEQHSRVCIPAVCLIGRCLAKVREEQATLIIVMPTWQGRPISMRPCYIWQSIIPYCCPKCTTYSRDRQATHLENIRQMLEIQHYRQKLEICCNENYLEDQKGLPRPLENVVLLVWSKVIGSYFSSSGVCSKSFSQKAAPSRLFCS